MTRDPEDWRRPRLVPAQGAQGEAPHFEALTQEPWLRIAPFPAFARGRWLRLRYRLSLYDRPTPPLVSFWRGSQEIGRRRLPGPALGRGEGVLLAPAGATAVLVSPVARKGPFSFAIDEIAPLSGLELLRLGWAGERRRLASACATRALRWGPEAELNMCWAALHAPLGDWPAYRDRRSVMPEPAGFERPRCDWDDAPTVRLFALAEADASAAGATLASLGAQIYPRWTLSIAGQGARTLASRLGDGRIQPFDGTFDAIAATDLVGFLGPGDRLAPHALACFIEAMAAEPAATAAYCDEDAGPAPVFKPDFSPRFEAERPYVGRLLLVRGRDARAALAAASLDEAGFAARALARLTRREVLHIARPLIVSQRPTLLHAEAPQSAARRWKPAPHVTVVMPGRDRAEFLARSVESLFRVTDYPCFDLVIVDNGSAEPAALDILARAEAMGRTTRLDAPGPFNFSLLCNLGAAAAKGEAILFLNNDVEIVDPFWMHELAALALEPGTGAVGCLLTYPGGRIQHAGLVVGMGEGVGHPDAGLDADAPGWLGRNAVPHEVSAVTGACLAVERRKFQSVGGFDEYFAVEFNDVDLCLRLEQAGFATLFTPRARLVHFESASRGKATFRRLAAHGAERACFAARWGDRLRDDPFYHPALSRFSLTPALA